MLVQNLAPSREAHPVFAKAATRYRGDPRFLLIDRDDEASSSSSSSSSSSFFSSLVRRQRRRRLLGASGAVQRQTRDVVLLLRSAARIFGGRGFAYYLFMEDDFLPCGNALLGLSCAYFFLSGTLFPLLQLLSVGRSGGRAVRRAVGLSLGPHWLNTAAHYFTSSQNQINPNQTQSVINPSASSAGVDLVGRANKDHGAGGWAALRVSYGLNGILVRGTSAGGGGNGDGDGDGDHKHAKSDVLAIADHLSAGASRRPPDHLFFEWAEQWAKRARRHGSGHPIVAFRYNLFFHLGTSSVVGNSATRFIPSCYELLYDWLQVRPPLAVACDGRKGGSTPAHTHELTKSRPDPLPN